MVDRLADGTGADLSVLRAVSCGAYRLLAQSPRRWWLYPAAAAISVHMVSSPISSRPIWIAPLF